MKILLSSKKVTKFYIIIFKKKNYETVNKLSTERIKEIKDDFNRKYLLGQDIVNDLDSWIVFYFSKGKLPGSQNLNFIPQIDVPDFIKTDMPLSPINLYNKFKATNAKALVSMQGLAPLNIYLGGDRNISKRASIEFLSNLTFQALSKENDNILLKFDEVGVLVIDILGNLVKLEKKLVDECEILGENLKSKLNETKYELNLPSELEIQENVIKNCKEGKVPPPLPQTSSIKKEDISKNYGKEKENYLKTAITIHKTDENAEEKAIHNIIDPTPRLVVDDQINPDKQFKFKSNDLDREFNLSNNTQQRLNVLLKMLADYNQPKETSVENPTEEIPNDPLSSERSDIKTEAFFNDDDYISNFLFFPQPSADNRKDFEIKIGGNDLLVYKSSTLTTVNVSRKTLKQALNNIIKDLTANIFDFRYERKTERKIKKVKNLINNIDSLEKKVIENKLVNIKWLNQLVRDQLINKGDYYTFGENFEENKTTEAKIEKVRKNPYDNVTIRKRKLLPLTSNERLEELPSIYTEIPMDETKKIEAASKVFDKIIKQFLPNPKKFKINYDEKNNITIDE